MSINLALCLIVVLAYLIGTPILFYELYKDIKDMEDKNK